MADSQRARVPCVHPLRTTVGFELWMGNRPGANGYLDESVFPTFNEQELNDYARTGEVAYCVHSVCARVKCLVRLMILAKTKTCREARRAVQRA